MKKTVLCLLLAGCIPALYAQKDFNILKYGAVSGLSNSNTTAIQKAIDAAAQKGGRVVVPAGNYVTGPLMLKSNVELHLQKDAVLAGSEKRLDYGEGKMSLVVCMGQKNVSVTGKGVIDGHGREIVENALMLLNEGKLEDDPEWLVKRPTERNRPSVLFFKQCTNVKVTGITLKNAASWVQNYKECTQVFIDSITVQSTAYWNNDGIDIVDSKKVKISNSYFNAADDAICLKSEITEGVCEDVVVENCIARSSANGFKIGTGSLGGFRNITVKNLTVFDTYRSAVALETVDGAFLENVTVSNVNARNTGNAIFIRLGHRNKDNRYSTLQHVLIENVKAEIPLRKPDMGYPVEGPLPKVPPHNLLPSSIAGLPGHTIKDVQLKNIEIIYGGGSSREKAEVKMDSLGSITENPAGYPEFTMFGELPAWGFYVRHAENIIMNNCTVKLKQDDFRPAIVFDDVKGLVLEKINIPATATLPALIFKQVQGLERTQVVLPADNKAVLTIQ
ncbi:Glycosyl hydrolases family 28 [Filimonas lacunae]|uniref:Glycosyl hydrolases family 28 n=1 Tax=Filimonas lacunae TaxID=477680 RepID=A0A173MGN0_9BACT|nr:glycosyl hydrolase family 28 protein [Filimonas lacunae]BAV06745.1 glycoside hydrolase, family 28 [Filimonas lacunae]SIT34425.1 Glycosyl hydrolases family 28 [Filimonas lacunae]